ncbi:SMP-30/gluconolactonase/LRE family protein [Rhizobium skierniewicense]|uniref:SMP-30/gluconolactonase/LRE family protein n=1 Tax=Rhizobium skierniewicense TaxID=984260 RepID=UPI001FADACAB|nr:SMP-30/gluconolactonase/LRE family protein [Rhizobium skierniewicense]MCI9867456.1 SMP-30/gluconolactonase/LRE family protein [Rhizobium skierniewicense]
MKLPRTIEPTFRQLIDVPLKVGESPVWDERTGDLWFVDIPTPAVFCLRRGGKLDRFEMPAPVGCLGLCESEMIVVGLQKGVHLLDPANGRLELLCDPDEGRPDSRLNDGKIGPDGHFWVGTRDEAVPPTANARLYRVAPNGDVQRKIDQNMFTSNGLAWSADGQRMYHSDSSGLLLQVFDFEPQTGEIGAPQRLHDFNDGEGRPDGGATDSEGFYWSAGVQAGKLNRFSPDGEIVEIYTFPFKGPTMPCFGGPDLKTLFVTSLTTENHGTSVAGTVIAFDAPAPGVPVHRFAK